MTVSNPLVMAGVTLPPLTCSVLVPVRRVAQRMHLDVSRYWLAYPLSGSCGRDNSDALGDILLPCRTLQPARRLPS
jgi:hypothetical protein